jgi:hypothetical protein
MRDDDRRRGGPLYSAIPGSWFGVSRGAAAAGLHVKVVVVLVVQDVAAQVECESRI